MIGLQLHFGTVFWHFLLPSNAIIALYQLHFAGFGTVPGHIGFDKVEFCNEGMFYPITYYRYIQEKRVTHVCLERKKNSNMNQRQKKSMTDKKSSF